MEIKTYQEDYKEQIIDLILGIQNNEAKINLTIEEQPDLLDIHNSYKKCGGEFWVAVENDKVVGTIALMNKGNGKGVLKKFFVRKDLRGKKTGLKLYNELLHFAIKNNITNIVLDTPAVAVDSHKFYEKSGFKRISKEELPFDYDYPNRDSYLYLLKIRVKQK